MDSSSIFSKLSLVSAGFANMSPIRRNRIPTKNLTFLIRISASLIVNKRFQVFGSFSYHYREEECVGGRGTGRKEEVEKGNGERNEVEGGIERGGWRGMGRKEEVEKENRERNRERE